MSPPAWGWPVWMDQSLDSFADVPTRVGMARRTSAPSNPVIRCPHPRGDGPAAEALEKLDGVMSPPAWGWPGCRGPGETRWCDVPTRVGMARGATRRIRAGMGCPHPRGDGPRHHPPWRVDRLMSPPAWGWPARRDDSLRVRSDVPTRVGMARDHRRRCHQCPGCPHPRGDGPAKTINSSARTPMSPPAWGWPGAVANQPRRIPDVPTRVGMARCATSILRFSARCPHPRGDGPATPAMLAPRATMSPPAWGWPAEAVKLAGGFLDVPTRVGMARIPQHRGVLGGGGPHPRGDGPSQRIAQTSSSRMSPPAWGWHSNRKGGPRIDAFDLAKLL